MNPTELKEVWCLLMLIPFGIVLATGLSMVFCSWRRKFMAKPTPPDDPAAVSVGAHPALSSALVGQPCRWLAVKGASPTAVQTALNLHRVISCSWEEGLVEAREDKLFISPSIGGWVLVIGSGLPDPAQDVDVCYRFLTTLSRKVGHLQFFAVNKVLSTHAWVLMEKGHIFRAYAWAEGITLWNQGPLTAAEKELGMTCFAYAAGLDLFAARESLAANCEKVNALAGRWSLDPSAISPAHWSAYGLVGEVPHSNPR